MSELNSSSILDKFRALSTQKFVPLQASLELTYRCNERCTHCYLETFQDDPQRILSKEDWFKILSELRSAGTLYLFLMGGEAMLSPYFWDIAEKASEMGFYVSMISNGLKIKDKETAERLNQVGVKQISFSLYSLEPEIHEKMTSVRGSHAKTVRAIELCMEAGIDVGVNSLLTEANARGQFELFDWCLQKGIELKVDPNVTPKVNGDLTPIQYRASEETLLWFYRERAKRWKASIPQPSMETMDSYVCNAGKGKCAVNPYGELLPCIEIRESMGSLVKNSFQELWFRSEMKKWREPKVKDLKGVESLEFQNHCEHCPGMAKNENGDPMQMTCFSKKVAKAKIQVRKEFLELEEIESHP